MPRNNCLQNCLHFAERWQFDRTPNANRIGNWAELYGVGYAGNAENSAIGFNPAFVGLGSVSTMDSVAENDTNTAVCAMHFESDASFTVAGATNSPSRQKYARFQEICLSVQRAYNGPNGYQQD
jgi:hypothetical protein